MKDIIQRLDEMEDEIKKPSFRGSTGMTSDGNYWVFDYSPEQELEVRERIRYMQKRNAKGGEDFTLVVYDLYDIIIDFLEKNNYMEECYRFEKKKGLNRIAVAVSNSMKIKDSGNLIVRHIEENTPDNAIVFLTGVGKCFPILRSHTTLNILHDSFNRAPVVMFFPGVYNEQELILFGEIKDDNHYRARKIVK